MADPEKAMEVENDHEDIDDEETDGVVGKSTMAAELLKNPAMFAALQGKLNSMVGVNSGYISVRVFKFFNQSRHEIRRAEKFSLFLQRTHIALAMKTPVFIHPTAVTK